LGRKNDRRITIMSSTFLHEDKVIPPDEVLDTDPPLCRTCQVDMWLTKAETKFADGRIELRKEYECKLCGRLSPLSIKLPQ
jgi:hypothetical protein